MKVGEHYKSVHNLQFPKKMRLLHYLMTDAWKLQKLHLTNLALKQQKKKKNTARKKLKIAKLG